SALMPVLAGSGLDFVDEDAPVLQGRIGMIVRTKIIQKLSLPGLDHLAIRRANHDRPCSIALHRLVPLAHVALVSVVRDRTALPFTSSFDLGHRRFPFANRCSAPSGCRSSCQKI